MSEMSKKAFSAGVAITALVASTEWIQMMYISIVAIVALTVQGILDYHKQEKQDGRGSEG